ncbi:MULTISPECIES: hypothetical protein [Paenarthrobacter]|jgi:hypothetical protein|uniref:hypothetical protein n=1 Tax=Paenarthrobacter TaxID=1742992 RepID=UPI00222E92EC|nr:hypothetical protein [Paenarthrobacter sp. PAE-2]MCW3767219.1 hypothetical protein [Paenarthrobacter sp. PAE-2]
MTGAIKRRVRAFLRRTALFTGALAIIAGIFGMHLLATSHDMPMTVTGPAAAMVHSDPSMERASQQQTVTLAVSRSSTASGTATTAASSCADPVPCPAMSTMDQECIPALGNNALDVPLPGTSLLGYPADSNAGRLLSFTYLSSGPSPADLGISRT